MNEKEIRAIVRDEIEKASPKTEYPRLSQGGSQTVEPAPGSDAEHPPVGYRRLSFGEIRAPGYIIFFGGEWITPVLDFTGAPHDGKLPVANPITANEGDSRVMESVGFVIPIGWVLVHARAPFSEICLAHAGRNYKGLRIAPDPSIPWGEGYEAILPSEAGEGDEHFDGVDWYAFHLIGDGEVVEFYSWRRKVQPEAKTESVEDSRITHARVLADERDRALRSQATESNP